MVNLSRTLQKIILSKADRETYPPSLKNSFLDPLSPGTIVKNYQEI